MSILPVAAASYLELVDKTTSYDESSLRDGEGEGLQ